MASYPTAHISASPDDFAKTVLMPGDPLRSKFIAENFLEKSVLINNVRYAQGYTGIYRGKKVTVMSSGMGMPSMGIYSYELFSFFGVENIIRIGTAGADMETAALYMNAARLGKNALSVLTISDIIGTDEQTSPEEREKSFSDMVYTALETAANI